MKSSSSFVCLVLLLTTELCWGDFSSNTWQGFKNEGAAGYYSAILEFDDNGKGFFAISGGNFQSQDYVYSLDLSNSIQHKGYLEIRWIAESGAEHLLLLADNNVRNQINAIHMVSESATNIIVSEAWDLKLVKNQLMDKTLYEFAKDVYNKRNMAPAQSAG